MNKSESILNILPAIVEAKKHFGEIKKTKQAYGYKYAPIDEILAQIEKPLLDHGLFITHHKDIEKKILTTYVFHTSGEFFSTTSPLEFKAENKMTLMQSYGSASTYATRYNLIALFNLCADEDNDGETSGDKGYKPKYQSPVDPDRTAKIARLIECAEKYQCKDEVMHIVENKKPTLWSDDELTKIRDLIVQKKEASSKSADYDKPTIKETAPPIKPYPSINDKKPFDHAQFVKLSDLLRMCQELGLESKVQKITNSNLKFTSWSNEEIAKVEQLLKDHTRP